LGDRGYVESRACAIQRAQLQQIGVFYKENEMPQKVRYYGDRATFPAGACVHCLRPATQKIELVRVKGRLSGGYAVRKVEVPFCDACVALREAKTPRQVLFQRVAIGQSLLLSAVVAVYVYVTTASIGSGVWRVTGNWTWRALLGVLSGQVVFGILYLVVRPWARRFRSAETRAALRAVSIAGFDWETTTLQFADDEYAERFIRANSSGTRE
jgi:hypothetical protein